ncbi:Nibrin [Heterocephalus glaber]|uniref:Nibrin n=1 Tax=Heterocephalus glaber TaxID=10181 RepID=G5C1C4_HETGA|nr:Nibrin [Heterocephalus glaber]
MDTKPENLFTDNEDLKSSVKNPDSKSVSTESLKSKKERKEIDLAIEDELLEQLFKNTRPQLEIEVKVDRQEEDLNIRKKPRLDIETNNSFDDKIYPKVTKYLKKVKLGTNVSSRKNHYGQLRKSLIMMNFRKKVIND